MPKLATQSWAVRRALASRQPFRTHGALSATAERTYCVGWLPETWADRYRSDADAGRIIYQVFSYSTPIAWVLDDGTVVVPHVRYSITTSGHQGLLYALDSEPGSFPQDGPDEGPFVPTQAPGSWNWLVGSGARPRNRRRPVREDFTPVRDDFAPVRMEYSESYSVRQGWATSYDIGPASGVEQAA
ncbi:hypothetical protein IAG44_39970 [Streptomyces roseirectus]|uniref:DUF8033 domain-containing protein n=1 Tax=Streptomyces roseirectus TaxID=2768066 RepID=A0A7H0IQC4_9ACTN|nr:hypothetical protein [Streptomyces roseirectus]QNP74990.1 hypothetical protein IAG44_39970 [Streptomyces roseirectus]